MCGRNKYRLSSFPSFFRVSFFFLLYSRDREKRKWKKLSVFPSIKRGLETEEGCCLFPARGMNSRTQEHTHTRTHARARTRRMRKHDPLLGCFYLHLFASFSLSFSFHSLSLSLSPTHPTLFFAYLSTVWTFLSPSHWLQQELFLSSVFCTWGNSWENWNFTILKGEGDQPTLF